MRKPGNQSAMAFRRSGDKAATMEIENDAPSGRRLRDNPLASNGADQNGLHVDAGLHRSESRPKLFDVFPQILDRCGRIESGLAPRQCGTATKGTRPIHHTGAAPNSITATAPPHVSKKLSPPIATAPSHNQHYRSGTRLRITFSTGSGKNARGIKQIHKHTPVQNDSTCERPHILAHRWRA